MISRRGCSASVLAFHLALAALSVSCGGKEQPSTTQPTPTTITMTSGSGDTATYQAQETSSTPESHVPCPDVKSYTASAAKVKRGQAVILSWDVPGADRVDIYAVSLPATRDSIKAVLKGGASSGQVKVFPTARQTNYNLSIFDSCPQPAAEKTRVLHVETE